jgi:hypothetical protein
MGRATTTTLAQLGIHVLGVGRHAERDGVGAGSRTCWLRIMFRDLS